MGSPNCCWQCWEVDRLVLAHKEKRSPSESESDRCLGCVIKKYLVPIYDERIVNEAQSEIDRSQFFVVLACSIQAISRFQ